MDKELQILNINGEAYSITDKQSREDIKQIKGKSFITSTSLNTDYEEATKTLTVSVSTQSSTIGG